MTSLPPGMYPPPTHGNGRHASQPVYGQQLLPGWESRMKGQGGGGGGGYGGGDGGGTFGDAFDFSFSRYATPAIVKILYPVLVVLVLLQYVMAVLYAFGVGFLMTLGLPLLFPVGPILGVFTLVFGWIPGFLAILGARLGCEHALAVVRTAMDVRALRAHYVGHPPLE